MDSGQTPPPQTNTNSGQTSVAPPQARPWFKTWWGVLLIIVLWPIFAI